MRDILPPHPVYLCRSRLTDDICYHFRAARIMMKKQNLQRMYTLAATIGMISLVAVLWYLIPRAQNFGVISSDEVDDLLYERLDAYEQALANDVGLANAVQAALTEPESLTEADRQRYISHERRFFSGWEVAWEHHSAGYFEPRRFHIWDNWYVAETNRRPAFAWQENKHNFGSSFVRHVDQVLGIRVADITDSK